MILKMMMAQATAKKVNGVVVSRPFVLYWKGIEMPFLLFVMSRTGGGARHLGYGGFGTI